MNRKRYEQKSDSKFNSINLTNNNGNNETYEAYKNEINNEYFDMKYISPLNFKVIQNTISAKNLSRVHKYIFANEKYDIKKDSPQTYKILLKLIDKVNWLAFGICDKKKVEENDFKFAPNNKDIKDRNNGSYILSVNAMIWNSNNSQECKKLRNFDSQKWGCAGNEIEVRINPTKKTMEYYINNQSIVSLTNIKLFKSEVFTPCIIFMTNCSVSIYYYYPI